LVSASLGRAIGRGRRSNRGLTSIALLRNLLLLLTQTRIERPERVVELFVESGAAFFGGFRIRRRDG